MGNAELSPDGRSLAVITFDDKTKTTAISVYPVAGGEPRVVFQMNRPDSLTLYNHMSWTPDGQALLAVHMTGDDVASSTPNALWLVPMDGGRARKLDIDIRRWVIGQGIRLHPNGRQIAFFTGQDSREVWALENVATRGDLERWGLTAFRRE